MKLVMLTDIGVKADMKEWNDIRSCVDVIVYHDSTPDLVVERAKGAEILLTNKVVITPEHLEQLPDVKYIIMASTGTNVVDLDYCHKRGIWCSNVPAYSTNSVAQLVFSHLLNIYTQAGHYAEKNRNGAWSSTTDFCYADAPLYELAGKTLGIVGLGAIGQRVAQIALAFGMNVMAKTSKTDLPQGITKADSLDDLYANADIITLHCPLAADNTKMINATSIAKMKEGVIIVNTARGGLVDETALRSALDFGKVAAFAADVISAEPARKDNPVVSHPHAYITPHNAWMTEEALRRLNLTMIKNIKAYLKEGKPVDVV
ncbi:MAG: D-2-hydroxyacid dehydrogenase [Bacteroidaceae bacterium]|nr:D-2-hydroxyacid dehydrogenase [Bacteroidaceae bacterium]